MWRGILAVVVAFGLAACSPGFDAPRWGAERGNATGVNARLDMVASLGTVGVAVGASRPRVRAALGLPDGEGPREDIYYLGRNDMAPDFLVLAIGYTDAGRVAVLRTREP